MKKREKFRMYLQSALSLCQAWVWYHLELLDTTGGHPGGDIVPA